MKEILNQLNTTDKTSLISAINEVNTKSQGAQVALPDGFGDTGKRITDWNTIKENGMYMGVDATGAPVTGWLMGTVEVHNDNFIMQTVKELTGEKEWQRRSYNGAWEKWIETSPKKALSTANKAFDHLFNGKMSYSNGREFEINGTFLNLGILEPKDFRTVLDSQLLSRYGDLKCFANTADLGITASVNHYGILTTIKPWLDESGGVLTQTFEADDITQKRFQVDDTTWSPWVTIQHKDVDIKSLFTSVSNGKAAIANAITGKGISTAADAEFATMANNVANISSGKKWATGTATSSNHTVTFQHASGGPTDSHFLSVSYNLGFTPSVIIAEVYGQVYGNLFMTMYKKESPHINDTIRTSSYGTSYVTSSQHQYRNNAQNAYVRSDGFCLPAVQNLTYTWIAYE